jgi:hypothetical protein
MLAYVATLAPTITWRNSAADSGDLVTAAYTFGISHPPGYPLYTLLAAAFAHLPFGEAAHNVGFFSALAAAGSIVLISKSARALISDHPQNLVSSLVPPSAALMIAFAPLFWSQATVAEIYAFNILIVSAFVAVLLSESRARLFLAALAFGLGLAHHLTIVLLAPSAFVLLADARWKRRELIFACAIVLVPLFFYLYLPLRASAQPPVNWGDPRTVGNFMWTATAVPYHAYLFGLPLADLYPRLGAAVQSLFDQFKVWGVALGLWGVAQLAFSRDEKMRRRLVALALACVLAMAYSVVYVTRNSFVYLLPAFVVFTLWVAYGLVDLADRFSGRWGRAAVGAALILLPACNLAANYRAMDLSQDRSALEYAQRTMAAVPRDAILLADGDEHLFALWYDRYVVARDSAVVVVSPELLQYDWYYAEIRKALPYLGTNPVGELSEQDRVRSIEIVDRTLEQGRAVFTTSPRDWLARYVYEQQGDLFWIQKLAR